jgi:hypothetical protein
VSGTLLPLLALGDPTRRRETRDRLEVLTALLHGPHVEPLFRQDVIHPLSDHPVFGWICRVDGCHHPRTNAHDLCSPHRMQWMSKRRANPELTRRDFLRQAEPTRFYARMAEPPLCRLCPNARPTIMGCACA